MTDKLELFKASLTEGVSDLLYYSRRNDTDLSPDDVLELVRAKKITPELMVEWFCAAVIEVFKGNFNGLDHHAISPSEDQRDLRVE